jgi:glycosyltransferase involved in cell wall biosynthesis
LTLPSWNEGTPSVLLESLASGRPVVMTAVGGIPDLVDRPLFGELVAPRDLDALAGALDRVSAKPHDAAEIARCSGLTDWSESAAVMKDELSRAIATHRRGSA